MSSRRSPVRSAPHKAKPKPAPANAPESPAAERLQKVMASAGIGSRRHCEQLILAGRVEVDRRVSRELGVKVDPSTQEVRVDGMPLAPSRRVYYLVNKPPGVVSTNFDPAGRTRVIDLLPATRERLFTVGRLDMSSEGLILVTNDGALANRLAHPRYGVEKTYHVLVAGTPPRDVLAKLKHGIHLAEGFARVERVRIRNEFKQSTLLEIVLAEGRNREIRRLLAKVGHKVLRLKRVALGEVRLKDLPLGEHRRLHTDELKLLQQRRRPPTRRPQPTEAAPELAQAASPAPASKLTASAPTTRSRSPASRPGSAGAKRPITARGARQPRAGQASKGRLRGNRA